MKISDSIIEGLGKRDEKAYADLFDACYAQLHELAYTYVLDYDLADDIVQEVLITLYERANMEDIANLASYLRISVRNRSFNYLRNLSLEVQHRDLYILEFSQREELDESEMAAVYDVLKREVSNLPKSCRKICQLRFYDGLKIREIAEAVGVSEGTVKAQLHRALIAIRNAMKEDGFSHLSLIKCVIFMIFFHIL